MQIIHNNAILTNRPVQPAQKQAERQGVTQNQGANFQQILGQTIENKEIQFSKHAQMRMQSRDIQFTNEQMERLQSGVKKAGSKGINDSLVLIDDVALLVNVKSKMVITAMDQQEQEEKVFTNIDGAVIV